MPKMLAGATGDGAAHLRLSQGFGPSPYAPQVLYPVTAAPRPAWMLEAIRPAILETAAAQSGPSRPVIAICIDDLGPNLAGTAKAMAAAGHKHLFRKIEGGGSLDLVTVDGDKDFVTDKGAEVYAILKGKNINKAHPISAYFAR